MNFWVPSSEVNYIYQGTSEQLQLSIPAILISTLNMQDFQNNDQINVIVHKQF